VKNNFILLHWLNFDIALGAVVTSLFVASSLAIEIPNSALVALGLSVLAIYNFDHLLDARRINDIALSSRHRYYQTNLKMLAIYQILLLLAILMTSWFVPFKILQAGSILAIITLIYFILLFIVLPNKFALKELIIALVYACGLFLAPVVITDFIFSWQMMVLWGQVFLLALINILVFSWFDYELDLKERHTSLALVIGKEKIHQLNIALLGLLVLSIIAMIFIGIAIQTQIVILVMGTILLLCILLNQRLRKKELFRLVADAIFLVPLIYLLGK